MSFSSVLPEATFATVCRVDEEIRTVLGEQWEPSDDLVNATAEFHLALDRERLLTLQRAAHMALFIQLPELDVARLRMQPDGSAPNAVMSSLLHLQSELEKMFAVVGKSAEGSIHPRVKEWSEVIRAALRVVYDSVEAMRWEILEAEADADLAAGRVMRFSSPKNAAAFLRRIGK